MPRDRKELINEQEMTIEHIINTPARDRYYSIVLPMGGNTKNFLKNNVVLWLHNQSTRDGMPIGKCVLLEQSDEGIRVKTKFNSNDEFAVKVFNLFKDGFLNAWSIGFRPTKVEFVNAENREFINSKYNLSITEKDVMEAECASWSGFTVVPEWDLLEYSAVPVPGNQEALTEDFVRSVHARGLELVDEATMKKFGLNRDISRTLFIDKSGVDMDKVEEGVKEVVSAVADAVEAVADTVIEKTEQVASVIEQVAETAVEVAHKVEDIVNGEQADLPKEGETVVLPEGTEATLATDAVASDEPVESVATEPAVETKTVEVHVVDKTVVESLRADINAIALCVKELSESISSASARSAQESLAKISENDAKFKVIEERLAILTDRIPEENIANVRKVAAAKATTKASSSWSASILKR